MSLASEFKAHNTRSTPSLSQCCRSFQTVPTLVRLADTTTVALRPQRPYGRTTGARGAKDGQLLSSSSSSVTLGYFTSTETARILKDHLSSKMTSPFSSTFPAPHHFLRSSPPGERWVGGTRSRTRVYAGVSPTTRRTEQTTVPLHSPLVGASGSQVSEQGQQ